jgi:hypothetical protein
LAQRKLEDIWEEHPKRLRSNLESPEKKSPRKSIFADIIDLSHLDDEDNEDVFVIVKIPRKDSVEKKKRFYFF